MKKTIIMSLAFSVCIGAFSYCLLALLMVGSFEAAGNYARERFDYNQRLWGSGAIFFLIATAVVGVFLFRHLKRPKRVDAKNHN